MRDSLFYNYVKPAMKKTYLLFMFALSAVAAHAQQPKILMTAHGYRFIPQITKGGPTVQPGETVKVHLDSYLGNTLMGSTRQEASAHELSIPSIDQMPPQVPAYLDALLLMSKGDSATTYMRLDSATRSTLPEGFQNYEEVRFEIVLLDIVSATEAMQKKQDLEARFAVVEASVKTAVKAYSDGSLAGQLTSLPSGLKVLVLKKGTGTPVKPGEKVETMYYGCLTNGTQFDNSFQRGQPLMFIVGAGQMIPGYEEGVQLLQRGGRAYFFLPPALAYGEAGMPPAVPPQSELIFYVEIL